MKSMYLSLITNFHCVMGHICLQLQMTDTSLQQARSILHLDKISTTELTTVLALHSTQVETMQTVLTLPFSLPYIVCEQNV